MKTQAWGWLAAAVLAAGLNSSYHNGGMQWAHEIADRVQHNTAAVLALATGRADQFLAEARMLKVERQTRECPLAAAVAEAQRSFDQSQSEFDQFQSLSGREQAQLARIEAQVQSKLTRIRFADNSFTFADSNIGDGNFSFTTDNFAPVVVQVPRIRCQHVRVTTPRIPRFRVKIPRIEVPAHVEVDNPGPGPV